ncbi:hypothetical protein [Nocardia sp. CA-120079]|uniref:hypothetical protein n=1 Tax=Nocardia sp. CA-120079 TaxID=3239974 RepID=UPI003D971035
MSAAQLLTIGVALPAAIGALQSLHLGRLFGSRRRAHLDLQELEHLSNVIDKLGDARCPEALRKKRDSVARSLASFYAVDYEPADRVMHRQFKVLYVVGIGALTVAINLGFPIMAGYPLVIAYVGVISIPSFRTQTRRRGRRLLYARLGDRDDLPSIPAASWALRSPVPSVNLFRLWVDKAVPNVDEDPSDVTDRQVAQINHSFSRWLRTPWWKHLRMWRLRRSRRRPAPN